MKRFMVLLLASLVALSATAQAAEKPKYTLEIVNIPDGENCLPVHGPDSGHQSVCAWRLHTNMDTMLRRALDAHLPTSGEYRVRFKLGAAELLTGVHSTSPVDRRVAFHFSVKDQTGKLIVDEKGNMMDPITNRKLPDAVLESPELYKPWVVYQLFFDLVDHISASIDQALKPAVVTK